MAYFIKFLAVWVKYDFISYLVHYLYVHHDEVNYTFSPHLTTLSQAVKVVFIGTPVTSGFYYLKLRLVHGLGWNTNALVFIYVLYISFWDLLAKVTCTIPIALSLHLMVLDE